MIVSSTKGLLQEALGLQRRGAINEAAARYAEVLRVDPGNADACYYLGMMACQQGRFVEGAEHANKVLASDPGYVRAHVLLGRALTALGRQDEALVTFDRALALAPDFSQAHGHRADVLSDLGRYSEAVDSYDRALALAPEYAEDWLNRGAALVAVERYDVAIVSFERAIACNPNFVEAHLRRAKALSDIHRDQEALEGVGKAIAVTPRAAKAWLGRGNILTKLKRYDEALAAFDRALTLEADLAAAWLGQGNALGDSRRYEDALVAYGRATTMAPDLAEAWLGRGNIFFQLCLYDDALAAYDRALALKRGLAEAWRGRGNVFNKLKRHVEAGAAYAEVLKIAPGHPSTKGMLLHQKALACDWKHIGVLILEIEDDLACGKLSTEPFGWQGVARSPRSLQLCAELYNKNQFSANIRAYPRQARVRRETIRIGYLSGEFRDQATSQLIVGVLESHDRSRFEIHGIDNGWDDHSELRKRINVALTKIININRLSDVAACAAIRKNEIDILVDLNGYFGEARMSLFGQRPAPIQVNYLGFPGTLGASYIDYIIADRHVIPTGHEAFYTEKVVYLPDCYQANDRKRSIATNGLGRAEHGLPQNGFVFCCFNNNYKITPDVFDSWMRILARVEGAVLWLLKDNADAVSNLRQEAKARGVCPDLLVFAERISSSDHLARHRLADLFLDTLPCNAHTTASDALWAGLPVLTQIGDTFAGRVAASLLQAIGLPELITSNSRDYEEQAIELAANPAELTAIRRKLANNRLTTPLFDTELFTRRIEAAYTAMYERYQAGLPPDHIALPS